MSTSAGALVVATHPTSAVHHVNVRRLLRCFGFPATRAVVSVSDAYEADTRHALAGQRATIVSSPNDRYDAGKWCVGLRALADADVEWIFLANDSIFLVRPLPDLVDRLRSGRFDIVGVWASSSGWPAPPGLAVPDSAPRYAGRFHIQSQLRGFTSAAVRAWTNYTCAAPQSSFADKRAVVVYHEMGSSHIFERARLSALYTVPGRDPWYRGLTNATRIDDAVDAHGLPILKAPSVHAICGAAASAPELERCLEAHWPGRCPAPRAAASAAGLVYVHVPKCGSTFSDIFARATCPSYRLQARDDGHRPILSEAHLGELRRGCTYGRGGFQVGHSPVSDKGYARSRGRLVMMQRRPASRAAAGFVHDLHDCKALQRRHRLTEAHELGEASSNSSLRFYARFWHEWTDAQRTALAREYAECVGACSVNMMTGGECGAPREDAAAVRARVTTAVQRVREGFAFVGLAEQWNRSLQLFSTMFGVELLPRTDLAVWRGGPRSDARAWVEALYAEMRFDDDAVYEAAAARFGELEREVLGRLIFSQLMKRTDARARG